VALYFCSLYRPSWCEEGEFYFTNMPYEYPLPVGEIYVCVCVCVYIYIYTHTHGKVFPVHIMKGYKTRTTGK